MLLTYDIAKAYRKIEFYIYTYVAIGINEKWGIFL